MLEAKRDFQPIDSTVILDDWGNFNGNITVGNTGIEIEAYGNPVTLTPFWMCNFTPETVDRPAISIEDKRKYLGVLAIGFEALINWWGDESKDTNFYRHNWIQGNTNETLLNTCKKFCGEHLWQLHHRDSVSPVTGIRQLCFEVDIQTLSQDQTKMNRLHRLAERARKQNYLLSTDIIA